MTDLDVTLAVIDRAVTHYTQRRALAEAATPGPWSAADEHGLLGPDASPAWCVSRMSPDGEYMYDVAYVDTQPGSQAEADSLHIAANDPASVIADCDRWLALAARDQATLQRHAPFTTSAGGINDRRVTRCRDHNLYYPCDDDRAIFDFWSSWDTPTTTDKEPTP